MRLLGYNKRQQRLLGLFPDDRLAFNHNKPSDPAFWHLSGANALHWQAVRLAPEVNTPTHLMQGAPSSSRVSLAMDASVQQAAAAIEPQRLRIVGRATQVGTRLGAQSSDALDRALGGELGEAAANLGTAASGSAVLVAAVDIVVGGRAPLRIKRAEGYVRPDGANGTGHDGPALEPLSTFNVMEHGQLYFQAYAGGWGWGACVKGPGCINWLIRAVEDEGGGELGMTQCAQVLALELGLTLGPAEAHRFHVPTTVTDIAFDTRVRLVQRGSGEA